MFQASLRAGRGRSWAAPVSLLLLLFPGAAGAQTIPGLPSAKAAAPSQPVAETTTPPAEQVVEAPDSPRASARVFVDLATRKGDFKSASRYLAVPPDQSARGPELARRLRAVLERHIDVNLDALSPQSEGNTEDGLPAGVDQVGQVPDDSGGHDPVFIVRTRRAGEYIWAFSPQTVARIDGWYDALPDRWIREWLPNQLQRYGPLGLMWWQWLALPALALVALVIGRVLGAFTTAVLQRIFRRTPTEWDERLLRRTSPALTLLWGVAAAAVLLPWLALLPEASRLVRSLLGGLATLAAFWALWRSVDVWSQYLMLRPWAADNPSARSLLMVTRNLLKVIVAVGGVVATLAAFGYPVATMLAGLGIGGLALAFGAQKTIENLFGSVALAADQPFRVGDFVKIQDFTGNVERIGMRSTQIRTLDRTVITLPNGQLSEMRIEDFGSRDRIRFATTVSLVYETTEAQMRAVVSGIEGTLRAMPHVWPDLVVSKFLAFGNSSLDIEVLCWFQTTDINEFRELRQDALLGIMKVVREAGTDFAYPTQTIHLESPAVATPPAGKGSGAA